MKLGGGVRLGPQAIMVNPHPAGPHTQFPASLIENDGPFFFFGWK